MTTRHVVAAAFVRPGAVSPGTHRRPVEYGSGSKRRPELLKTSHLRSRAQEACPFRRPSSHPTFAPLLNAQLRVLLLLLFGLLFAPRVEAALNLDTTTSYNASTFVTSFSWSHTVANQSNRLLLVWVGEEQQSGAAVDPSSVTYAGQALTKAVTATSGTSIFDGVSLWYLVAPNTGTNSITVTFPSSVDYPMGVAASVYGAKQAAPEVTNSSINNAGMTSTSITTLTAGSWVVDGLTSGEDAVDLTPISPQFAGPIASGNSTSLGISGLVVPSPTTVTMAWTQTTVNRTAQVVAAIAPATTTLATGVDPSSSTIAPGASATVADAFTLQTNSGTDTVTAISVNLGSSVFSGVSLVEIVNNAGSTVYGSSSNPVSDAFSISLTTSITATTTATTYKIRITPKSHAAQAAPAGASYAVAPRVTAWTGSYAQGGSDTAGATTTIDNLSPGNVTSATATSGSAQVSLAWTNPADADLGTIVVLRRTTSVVTDTPVEGTTYTVGNTIGSSTVACVVSAPTATRTDSGLTNGTAYYYKIYAKDTNGNYSATGVVPTGSPATPGLTTIATGSDPSTTTLAPGASATMADAFTLQTATGTDTVTSITVSLGSGAAAGLSLVEVTDTGGSTVYGSSSNPPSDTPTISLTTSITVTTTATTYKIRVTPKSHASMAAPSGATYTVTALVSTWSGNYAHSGADTAGATITVDNSSPANVSSATVTSGIAQVTLAWTNPGDADLGSIVVLRRTVSAVTDTPVEGTTYTVGNTIGSSTVACVVSAPTATCTDTGLTNGTAYYYKVFANDTNGNYSATGVVPTGSPVTPNVTTLATGTDPSNATLAPGASATMADAFTFQTGSGTDTITAVTVSLAAGTSAGLSLVEITDSAGTTVYGSVTNPGSDTPAVALTTNITATTTATTYKIRITPKSHANMTAPAGASYATTAIVSTWTGTNSHAGSDTAGATITIDNLSPGNVTSATATAGNTQVSLAWTNPADADLSSIVVLRRTVSVVTDTPVEGTVYTVGNTIGSSTVACVVSAPTATCTDTGLTNGTAYYYKVFAKDSNGNYSATGVVPTGSPVTPNVTTLATGVDPSNASLAPGGAATMADAFTLQTSSSTDTITAITVTLAAGTSAGLSLVEITDSAGSTVYGSVANPGSDTPAISLTTSITATISATTYKIRVTPKSHANMPAPAGSTYSVTALVSGWTSSNAQAGSDTGGTTITIDNLSPGNVSAATVSSGSTQAFLSWTNPADADLGTIIVLRRAASAVADVPTEGATYTVGNTIGASTVACVVSAPTSSCTDTGLTNGTAYYFKVFSKDTNGNYSTGIAPTGSPVTPSAGITVTPTSGLSVSETGTTATFTIVLTSQPAASVTVGVSSNDTTEGTVSPASVTFTTGNWNTPQTVTVTGVDDSLDDGDIAYSIITAAATSSDTGYSGINPSDVSVTTVDNDASGLTVTPTSGLTTTEAGGTATFTVVLTAQPTASVTVGVTSSNTAEGTVSPSSLVFTTANWNTPQTVTVTGVNDFVVDGSVAYSIVTAAATSSDGNYNGLNPSDVSVTNTDNDTAAITVAPTSGLKTTEAGGATTFTVVLTSQPTANVSIGLSSSNTAEGSVSPSSLVFTSSNWNTPQTVTVTGVDDALDDGDIAYSIVTAAATSADTNYSGLNASDVSVTNTDNDVSGFTVTPTSGLTTTEAGGTATFTVVLTAQPTANVSVGISSNDTTEGTVSPTSLVFTSANWNTPQTVTITGVDDALDDGDIVYAIVTAAATSSDTNYNGLNPSDVSVTNTDDDASGFAVSTISRNTTEPGGTATFTIRLTSQPTANVTVGLTSSNTAEGTVSPSSVMFTSGNWNTPQTVTVTGVDDDLDDGNVAYSIVTAAAASSDVTYNGLNPADVAVTNADDDTSGFGVSGISGNTTEAGGTATFTLVLTAQPTANVTVGISSSNTAEGTVSPSSLVFTSGNWSTPQTVTVTGVDDSLDDGNVAYSIVTAVATSADTNYNGLNPSDVSVTNIDNDASGFTVTPTSGLTTTEAGGTATFTIVLTAQPTANVTVALSSSNTAEGTVSPSSVTFTSGNWNTPQTVTVTGVDDALDDGDIAYSVVTAAATSADTNYNGLNPSDVSVTNTDNDASGITVTPTSGLTTTEAGGAATFTVVLTSQPTANVTVGVSSSNTAEGTVSPSSVTFTSGNWNTSQTVTVTGVDDFLVDGAQAYTIVTAAATSGDLNYSGLNASDVSVTNTDNDAAGITVTPTSGLTTTEAGGTATFTVVLTSQPTANVTMGLSSSNTAEGTVSPSSVTFTSGNWNTPQTVTVTGVDDFLVDGAQAYTIVTAAATSSDLNYSGLNASDVSVSNTDNDAAGITVTPTSGLTTTEAGGTATFTVVLTSQPTSSVTVGLSSSNTAEGSVSPSSVTFTSGNWNTPQTVTVTGVDDFLVDGAVAYTIVTAAATSSDVHYSGLNASDVSVTNTDNDAAGITVTPTSGLTTTEAGGTATFTVVLTSQPTANVTIGVSSANTAEGTVSPTSVTFTSGNWNTLQTVTVAGVDDFLVDGAVAYTVVTAAATSSDLNYSGLNASDVSVTNTDNDAAGITVTPTSGLTTTEAGGTATFTVVLTSQPTANVSMGLSSSNTAEGTVSPSSVTFTSGNWNTPQTVTVTGADDFLVDGAQAYTVVTAAATSSDLNYSGLNASDVSVTNTDNDAAAITVTPTSGLTTTEAGGTATFTVVLTSQPTANVTIGLSSSNTAEGTVAPSSVTFTSGNWNTPQTVTVTGVDDFLVDGAMAYSIVTAAATSSDLNYSGLNASDVSVTNTDNDAAGITVTPTSGLTTTEAGGTATFTVVLTSQPTANVTVGLSSSNTAEGTVSPSSVTFTSGNWSTPQTVTVTGVDDFLVDGAVAYTIVTAAATSSDLNYSGLNASDVSVSNTDNDAAGVTVTPTSGLTTTEAGGTATFTVVLTSQPTANVTIGVSSSNTAEGTVSPSSVTFTSGNWNTPQTVTVTGVDDFLVDGAQAYAIVTAAATSGDVHYSGLNASDVSVTNTDNDAAGITVTPTSGLTTTEAGGTATFTVVLTSQPTANVTIGLSSSNTAEGTASPSSVTFTSGNWNTPQTVTVTGVDDFLVDGAVAYTIVTAAATSSDLNYSGLNASDVSVTNTDNDAAGITVTPTSGLTTTEAGGTATFTVVLTSQPTANVSIGLSSSNTAEGTVSPSSVTFTSGNWNTPQTVTVTGVDDFLVDGAVGYTIVTAAATSSDPNYSGLNASDVSVSNTDNDAAGVTVTPTSGLTTTEVGGTATFTVVLTSQPTANVTIGLSGSNTAEGTVAPSSVTFTSGNWNTPQTVTVTGVDDFLVDGAVAYTIVTAAATSSDLNYSGFNASDVSVSNTDNDAAGITVSPTSGLTTMEAGGTATFTVVLTSQPTANVTIGLSSSNTVEGTVAPSSVTFTSGNWNTPQTVTVTGVDDFLVDGAQAYTIVTAAATSSDLNYSGLNASDVSVTNTDNDAAGITVSPASGLTTTEAGGTATFTVVLTSQPTANVSIGLSSSNTAEGTVSPSSVTFTSGNWNTPQTVTVTGVDDFLVDGAVGYTIVTAAATSSDLNYSGLNASDVSVSNTDNDAAGITVTPTSGLTTTEAGGAATFTVVLTSQPTANVTIGVSSSNTAEGTVSPTSVTFTNGNWNTPQTVTVTGVDDFLVDGAVGYTIVTAAATSSDLNYSGLNASDVSVTNTDNDAAGITVTPTSGLTTTEAGGTATFTVVLTSQPTANVTIGLSSSNTAEGTVSPSVTFTSGNWNTPQTVTVTGVDDFLVDGAVGYTIVTAAATSSDLNYSGFNASDVSVSNTDNDAAGITVSPTSGLTTTEAGGAATFTVVLTSQPTANVTVGLSSSNTAEGTVGPSSVTFTSGNWNTPQTVTVTGVDDFLVDGAVAYTIVTAAATSSDVHYSGLNASDVSVTNTDNDAAGVTVTPTSGLTTTEGGGTATFTLMLTSQPTANVTVGLSSSNTAEGTVSPSSVTFTSGNWNTPQTVTVTGVDDFLVDGAVAYSVVTAAATSSDVHYSGLNASDVNVTNTDNDAAGVTVTPTSGLTTTEVGGTATFTVVLTSQPTANVTVGLSSSNTAEGTVAPSSVMFTSGNWNTPQTVTVTGVDDFLVDGAVAYTIVTAAATSSDVHYSGLNASDVSVTNTDNDAAGVTVTPTSGLTTTEAGGAATFTVVLTSQPTANVTIGVSSANTAEGTVSPSSVTFTNGNWNTPQTVTVTGVDDFLVDGAVAYTAVTAAATSSDVHYSGLNASDVTVTNTDNDAAGITVTPTSGLTTTEAGGAATFTVVLTSQPTANVTIGLSSSNTAEGTVSPSSVTFTNGNWNTPQTVTVTGVDDFLVDGAVGYTIVTAAATSSDVHYSGLNASDASVTNTDNDAAGITVTPTSGLTTTEAGGAATFTVALTSQPTANVTIGVSSSNTAEGTVSPSSVTFTSGNWNTPQTVTVTGVDDFLVDGAVAYTVVTAAATSSDLNYGGLNASDVSLTNTDNDAAGITVTPTSGLTTTEAGGTATFTVALTSQPTANVTMGLSSSNTAEGTVSPSSVTFTNGNWSTPQTVTVTGVDDFLVDGAQAYTIVTAAATSSDLNYSGLNASDVSVSNTDNDAAGITVTPTSGLTTTEAGGAATFTVVLTSQPTANVTIGVSSSNTAEGTASPSSVTFTSGNWNTPQTVTVIGVDDFLVDGAVAYTIVTAAATSSDVHYSGLNASDVTVTNTDNDAAGITVTPTSGLTTTEAGGTATFTVVLTSQPTANVTLGLSSSNTAEGTVSPSSVTFTNGNWNTPQTVTVTGVDDFAIDGPVAYTIVTAAATSADSHYSTLNAADVSVTNTDNDAAGITVTPTTGLGTTESGGTATFTIVLNTLPSADVTIALSTSNTAEGIVSPASVTFTSANWNTPRTVTVTGVDDFVLDGPIAYTIVTAPAVSADTHYSGLNPSDVSVTNADNDTASSLQADLAVTISDAATDVRPGQTVSYTVTVTNQGPAFVNGATLTVNTATGVSLGAWTCTATTGSSCSSAAGSGAVNTTLNLLATGVATLHVAATVSDPPPAAVTTTAAVMMPAGQTDPVAANNTAIDTDVVEAPRIGLSLRAGAPSVSGPASFDVPYTIEVTNTGAVPATNLQVIDSLSSAFASGKPTLSMVAAPATTGACNVSGGFTGIGESPAVVSGGSLTAGQTCTITMAVRVTYPSADAIPNTPQINKVTATAGSAQQAKAEAEASVKLVLPRVDITQALTGITQLGDEPVFDISFRIVVRNTSEADAHNVQVTHNLTQTFAAGSPTVTIIEGPTLGLLTAPTALTSAQAATAGPGAVAGLTLAPDFDGNTVKTLLKGDDTMPAGREQIITMTVRVRYPSSDAIPVDADLSSTPVVTTSVTPGGVVITRDESTDVTATSADPQPDDAPHPTVIRLTPHARLVVQKVASTRVAEIGDTVQYAVRVSNVGSSKLPAVTITDQVPLGFRYVDGSTRLLGDGNPVKIADPSTRGGVLSFTLAEQQTNAATITYRLRVGPGADRSDGVNVAQAASGNARSGAARAKVIVAGGVFSTDACIIGKVFADLDGNGVQRAGEPGIPGVKLTLEDGTSIISDGEGQYSYCGLTPTTHVLVVDSLSMPRGAVLVPGSHRNAGDGRSQFVDVKNGEVRRVDVIEGSRNPAVLAEIEARRAADKGWRPSFAPEQRPMNAVAQAATTADAARVIAIGGSAMTLAESLAPAMRVGDPAGAGFAGASASPGLTPPSFAPGVRSMLVVGLLDGVLSLNTEKNNSRLAVSPGTAFERELTRLSGTFADGRGRYAGRGALFVKGQVAGDIGITVAYDSEKNAGTTLFRDIQPDAYYPITGDSSRKMFDAQSSSRFYARVERGRSFGLFGDILATTLGGDARRLGAFNRALTGVQTRIDTGRVTVAGFASHTALRQVVDEIAALGLSGPYSVSQPNGVSGSERVEIVTRDRNQPAVVLQMQPMTRLTDYEFEPFTGRLLFRRPIPSLDERLNPVSIRVTYEVDTTVDGSDPVKAWVGGVDTGLRVSKAIEFGGAWIEDETSGKPYRLRTANSTIRFGKGTTLTLEGAQTRGTTGTGALLTSVASATAEGAAARLELKHHSSRILARAFVATAQTGFVNPSAGLTPGRSEAGASAVATLTPSVKIVADAVHSEDQATGATRDGGMVAVDATIARALGVEVGIRRSAQSATSGASGVPLTPSSTDGFGLGPNGTAIDPVSGLPLSRPGLTSTLSTGSIPSSAAIDQTSVRAKVIFMPSKRTNVYAEAEQDIRESAKRMAAVGMQVQVSTLNRAYARHEFISSLDSPYALNPTQRREATIIGLASAVTSTSDVFSEYRMRNAIDGRDAEAAIGLRNQWTLAEGLHVATSVERLQALSGTQRESTAMTGGMDYTRLSNLKATTRLEWRQDLTTQSWLSTLGVAERLSSSWTLLAKNYYQWVQQRSAAGQMQNRFSIGGAFRNPNSNRVNMLSRYELRVDRTSGAVDGMNIYRRVQSVSTHVDFQPARGWTLSGQHAAKWVEDRTDGGADVSRAQLLSGRLGVDVFSRLDVGALGSVMWGSGGGREQAVGAEVGVLLRGNWWLSFGDNAVGFRDTDFDIANTTARGPFTRLRLKFD